MCFFVPHGVDRQSKSSRITKLSLVQTSYELVSCISSVDYKCGWECEKKSNEKTLVHYYLACIWHSVCRNGAQKYHLMKWI